MFLFLILILFCSPSYAQPTQTITVKTGFGYLTDGNGHIVSKLEFLPGFQQIPVGDIYTEVPDELTLNSIQIYVDPVLLAQQQSQVQQNIIINQDEQALAIADLKSKGVLTAQQATSADSNLTALSQASQQVNATLP